CGGGRPRPDPFWVLVHPLPRGSVPAWFPVLPAFSAFSPLPPRFTATSKQQKQAKPASPAPIVPALLVAGAPDNATRARARSIPARISQPATRNSSSTPAMTRPHYAERPARAAREAHA